ncbi:MAG TPA: hypothetical protein VG756_03040 [Pseudonocardiaceae bacterium]|jgi:hypothetical protein|nr:hypothetical protein [Pseudonocardiaceae bacterium]
MSQAKKVRSVIGLAGIAFGIFRAVSELRTAKGKKDNLALINAVTSILSALTGAALVVRELRSGEEEDK